MSRFLIGETAVCVASMTGVVLETERDANRNPVRLLDIGKLDDWTRFRVVWALLAAYALYEALHGPHPDRYCFFDRRRPANRVSAVPGPRHRRLTNRWSPL